MANLIILIRQAELAMRNGLQCIGNFTTAATQINGKSS